jgi:hypothetical protein
VTKVVSVFVQVLNLPPRTSMPPQNDDEFEPDEEDI